MITRFMTLIICAFDNAFSAKTRCFLALSTDCELSLLAKERLLIVGEDLVLGQDGGWSFLAINLHPALELLDVLRASMEHAGVFQVGRGTDVEVVYARVLATLLVQFSSVRRWDRAWCPSLLVWGAATTPGRVLLSYIALTIVWSIELSERLVSGAHW